MKRCRVWRTALPLALIAALFGCGKAGAADAWYRDLTGHWARPYVYVLWEESVTDGYVDEHGRAFYEPESNTTRAELATLLCKVFGLAPQYPGAPSYPDVPKTYDLFPGKPGWPWIEGALSGGLVFVDPGEPFDPDGSITREDTVELLVRSLDLTGWAAALTGDEIEDILEPFHDHARVSESRRASMACAVSLGIIKGYEDHTIRPGAHIARGEAATVVARSCLIRMSARGDVFSPDGDGIDDSMTFDVGYLRNRGITQWQASIENSLGKTVYLFNTVDVSGEPPQTVTWSGADLKGGIVSDGVYYYQAWVWDREGRQFSSVRKPVTVELYWLQASISPTLFKDGNLLTVSALTQPAAESVTVTFADGNARPLKPSHRSTRWTASITAGSFIPPGAQSALVSATFERAHRQASLSFTKLEDTWIAPSVSPNPASWGQNILIRCDASRSITQVEAELFGTTVPLKPENGSWLGNVVVPWGLAPGFYPVSFLGTAAGSKVTAIISLEVRGPGVESLTYFLTR